MRWINKGPEPNVLTKYRSEGGTYADFSAANGKDDVKQQLLTEQSRTCAYCTQSIRKLALEKVKLEHWHPQSIPPDRTLYYGNMLACCTGTTIDNGIVRYHCNTSKGSTPIVLSPLRQEHIDQLAYDRASGEIRSDNPDLHDDLTNPDKLNLNCAPFTKRRKRVMRTFLTSINTRKAKGKPINAQRKLSYLLEHREAFDDIVIAYLRGRVAKGR